VLVQGARGQPPTATYKVCATYHGGWFGIALQPVIGLQARAKAVRQAQALIERARGLLRERDLGDYSRVHVEPLGAEATYGAHATTGDCREVFCRTVVEHTDKRAVDIFLREAVSPRTSMAVGSIVWFGGPPMSMPVIKLFSFVFPKSEVAITVALDGHRERIDVPVSGGFDESMIAGVNEPPACAETSDLVAVPLINLAWARSGDKGDIFNVGVIARQPDYLPWIWKALTEPAVHSWFAHFFADAKGSRVERFFLPGLHAINLLCHEALAGGGAGSVRLDPLAKGMAQQLLEIPVPVPREMVIRDKLSDE
jgi:hypothetical protein